MQIIASLKTFTNNTSNHFPSQDTDLLENNAPSVVCGSSPPTCERPPSHPLTDLSITRLPCRGYIPYCPFLTFIPSESHQATGPSSFKYSTFLAYLPHVCLRPIYESRYLLLLPNKYSTEHIL